MARILTGIQSTGNPHLGNLLGAIIPAITLSKKEENESLFFIADLHSFTTIRDAELFKQLENTKQIEIHSTFYEIEGQVETWERQK